MFGSTPGVTNMPVAAPWYLSMQASPMTVSSPAVVYGMPSAAQPTIVSGFPRRPGQQGPVIGGQHRDGGVAMRRPYPVFGNGLMGRCAVPQPASALSSGSGSSTTTTSPSTVTEQKQMLGERLYPMIQQIDAMNAGKITGMLLEMDTYEIVHLLESTEALAAKVDEAQRVLLAAGPRW